MKKFIMNMKAISEKEILINAVDEEHAYKQLENLYFDKESINFNDNDIVDMDISCKPIKSVRRERILSYNKSVDNANEIAKRYLEVLLNVLANADKKVDRKGFLDIKITQDDVDKLEEVFDIFFTE